MRCFYVLKKWSSAKLSLNRDLSLNKVSLNRDCTVLKVSEILRVVFMNKTNTKSLKSQLTQKFKTANFSFLAYCARVKSSCLEYLEYVTLTTTRLLLDHSNIHSHKGCVYALLYHTFRTLEKDIRTKVKEIFNVYACPHLI